MYYIWFFLDIQVLLCRIYSRPLIRTMSLISKKKRSEARKGWDETMKDVAHDFPLLLKKKAEKRETRKDLQRKVSLTPPFFLYRLFPNRSIEKKARRWTAYSSKDDLRRKIGFQTPSAFSLRSTPMPKFVYDRT